MEPGVIQKAATSFERRHFSVLIFDPGSGAGIDIKGYEMGDDESL